MTTAVRGGSLTSSDAPANDTPAIAAGEGWRHGRQVKSSVVSVQTMPMVMEQKLQFARPLWQAQTTASRAKHVCSAPWLTQLHPV